MSERSAMPDDLLGTVKAALADFNRVGSVLHDSGIVPKPHWLVETWIRRLVTRCEQAEADAEQRGRGNAEAERDHLTGKDLYDALVRAALAPPPEPYFHVAVERLDLDAGNVLMPSPVGGYERVTIDATLDLEAAAASLTARSAAAKTERLRAAIQTVMDSPGYMTDADIRVLLQAMKETA